MRGPLAVVSWSPVPAARRHRHADRMEPPACRSARIDPRGRAGRVCVVAAAGCGKRDAGCVEWAKCTRLSTAFTRPPPPWGGGVRCAWVARPSGGLGWCDGETRAATLDRHPASRHGDAVARDTDRGGTRASESPALTGGAMAFTSPGLAPGVSGARSGIRDGAARRAHRQPGGGVGVSRLPLVQRTDHPRRALPATHPLGSPAARLHTVGIYVVVGRAHAEPWGVGRGCPRHASDRRRRRAGAVRAPTAATGAARRGGRGGVGGLAGGGVVSRLVPRTSL